MKLKYLTPKTSVCVGAMDNDEANELFTKAAQVDLCTPEQREVIGNITAELGKHRPAQAFRAKFDWIELIPAIAGNLPLAIVQAGSCIISRRLTLDEFKGVFSHAKHDLLQTGRVGMISQDHVPIYVTLDMAFQSIRESIPLEIQEDALELFNLLSLFSSHGVAIETFDLVWATFDCLSRQQFEMIKVPRVLSPTCSSNVDGTWDKSRFWRAVECLEFFILIQEGKSTHLGQLILVHGLVHSWARFKLQSDGIRRDSARLMAISIISLAWRCEESVFSLSLFLHLKSCFSLSGGDHVCTEHLGMSLEASIRHLHQTYGELGNRLSIALASLFARRMPKAAERHLQTLSDYIPVSTGHNHHWTQIWLLRIMSDCKISLHAFRKAIKLEKRILDIQTQLFGMLHVQTIATRLQIAHCHINMEDYRPAKHILHEVTEMLKDITIEHSGQLETLRFGIQDCADRLQLMSWGKLDENRLVVKPPVLSPAVSYPEELVKILNDIYYSDSLGQTPITHTLALQGHRMSVKVLGHEHPLTTIFFSFSSRSNDLRVLENSLRLWETETKALGGPVTGKAHVSSSSIQAQIEALGAGHPEVLRDSIAFAMCGKRILQEGLGDGPILLRRSKQILLDGKDSYDRNSNINLRAFAATGFLLLSLAAKDQVNALRTQLLDQARQDLIELDRESTEWLGPKHPTTLRVLITLGQVLAEKADYKASCQVSAKALIDIVFYGLGSHAPHRGWCWLFREAVATLYLTTENFAALGDKHFSEALNRLALDSARRVYLESSSSMIDIHQPLIRNCADLKCTGKHRILPVDIKAMVRLAFYWNYRTRADDYSMHELRGLATGETAESYAHVSRLVTAFETTCQPHTYKDLAEDWRSDMVLLAGLLEQHARLGMERRGDIDQTTLRDIHEARDRYTYLKSREQEMRLERLLGTLCDSRGACPYEGCHGKHLETANKLEDMIYLEQQREECFSRIVDEIARFGIKSVLYVASGFVWESWLDDEHERSDPLKILRDAVEDAGTWFSETHFYDSVVSWSTKLSKRAPWKIKMD
ncbi:hypothetical protein FDECE_3845 [Fusarium decemcellulare]|nr:hypothetical protein FDECE_3845 [Fusarium decemcellulare]